MMKQFAREWDDLDSWEERAQIIKEGISCCLIGAPNVGKSSLMNLLLGKERAIVTNQPGTTRDVLEDQLQLGPLQLRLIDTAGIRITVRNLSRGSTS